MGSSKSCSEWQGAELSAPGQSRGRARADRERQLSKLSDRSLSLLQVRREDGQARGAELCAAAHPFPSLLSYPAELGVLATLRILVTLGVGKVRPFHPGNFLPPATGKRGAAVRRCFSTARQRGTFWVLGVFLDGCLPLFLPPFACLFERPSAFHSLCMSLSL